MVQYTKREKVYQTIIKYTKWPQNMPTSSIARTSKIYPNMNFGSTNMPSGNPGESFVAVWKNKESNFFSKKATLEFLFLRVSSPVGIGATLF
jgi:hypothetical protein